MAKKDDAMSVFEALEQAFSGAKEYDDVLMELDLHTAQVRKVCPHLFSAMSSINNNKVGVSKTFAEQLREMIRQEGSTRFVSDTSVEQPVSAVREEEQETVQARDWSEWAPALAHQTNTSDISLVRWDISGAPVPGLGQTITLRGENRRTRLTVLESRDDGVLKMQTIAILPPSFGG